MVGLLWDIFSPGQNGWNWEDKGLVVQQKYNWVTWGSSTINGGNQLLMLAGKLVYLRQRKQDLGIISNDFDEKVNSLKISELCNDDIEDDEK